MLPTKTAPAGGAHRLYFRLRQYLVIQEKDVTLHHSAMSPAGRPGELDEDDTLDRALRQFWRHGYEATSLTDLEIATGVEKDSLYEAFGDKHALFVTALDRYMTNVERETHDRLQHAASALGSLRSWLDGLSTRPRQAGPQHGCLAASGRAPMRSS